MRRGPDDPPAMFWRGTSTDGETVLVRLDMLAGLCRVPRDPDPNVWEWCIYIASQQTPIWIEDKQGGDLLALLEERFGIV